MTQDAARTTTSTETNRGTAPTQPQPVYCEQCGTDFEPRIKDGPNRQRFCSDTCRFAHHRMPAAITGTFVRVKTLADGTPRVEIDLDCKLNEAAAIVSMPGDTVALARLSAAAAKSVMPRPEHPYGEQAKALKLSGFFRRPDVWRAIGTDAEFLAWLRGLQCAVCKAEPAEAAHVRRVSNGAGVGIKPEFSAIPLCREHHAEQHQRGESAIGGSEWMDRKRIEYVEDWAWSVLKAELGYESMGDVPPSEVAAWAAANDLEQYLPEAYR